MIALVLLACGGPASREAELLPQGEVPLVHPDQQPGRELRRMNVDQLSRALEVTTGRTWTEGDAPLFDQLAGSLGKPDYLDSTEEQTDPGLLFQKFLGDAARQVCSELVREELTSPEGQRRLAVDVDLSRPPAEDDADTDRALVRAVLAFHGRRLTAEHEEVRAWRWLLDEVARESGTATAWQTVCVGLIVHPDFYTL